jgi:succinate-acetate transporter protein
VLLYAANAFVLAKWVCFTMRLLLGSWRATYEIQIVLDEVILEQLIW